MKRLTRGSASSGVNIQEDAGRAQAPLLYSRSESGSALPKQGEDPENSRCK